MAFKVAWKLTDGVHSHRPNYPFVTAALKVSQFWGCTEQPNVRMPKEYENVQHRIGNAPPLLPHTCSLQGQAAAMDHGYNSI